MIREHKVITSNSFGCIIHTPRAQLPRPLSDTEASSCPPHHPPARALSRHDVNARDRRPGNGRRLFRLPRLRRRTGGHASFGRVQTNTAVSRRLLYSEQPVGIVHDGRCRDFGSLTQTLSLTRPGDGNRRRMRGRAVRAR